MLPADEIMLMEKTGDHGVPAKEHKQRKAKERSKKRKLTQKEASDERTYLDDFSSKFK